MSLRTIARSASRLAPRAEALVASRSMSLAGMKGYDDRELAEETLFIKKEEEKNLRALLAKLKKQAEAKDAVGAAAARQLEIAALQPIIDKYQISDIDVDALIQWRHSAEH